MVDLKTNGEGCTHKTRSVALCGFQKWLYSTKFQVCILAFGLISMGLFWFGLDAGAFAGSVVKISIGYFGARVLEPVVDGLMSRANGNGGNYEND